MKKVISFIITTLLIFLVYKFYYKNNISNDYLKNVIFNQVNMNEYIIYGNHLNIKGTLNKGENLIDIKSISLVLKNNDQEINFDINYEENENNIEFYTSKEINSGIYLDDISKGDFAFLLKIEYNDDNNLIKYYGIKNNTNYKESVYYTVTKNGNNNKITISNKNYKLNNESFKYMNFNIKNSNDDNIYDIVIDPGHGGSDVGAVSGNYYESNLALSYSLKLEKKLKKLGLKVKLTRDTDVTVDSYGDLGRAVIPNKVKAKYLFSIHLNSTPYKMKNGGVEVYAPSNIDYGFARNLAYNIVNVTGSNYSNNTNDKIEDGIYVKYLSREDIASSVENAKKNNYEPYNIKNNTLYYFIIRETGGRITNAYVDGRDKKHGGNQFYDSNIGVESYLLELAFMSSDKDLNNFVKNMDKYVDAVVLSITKELNID